jgi:hypothetical protein
MGSSPIRVLVLVRLFSGPLMYVVPFIGLSLCAVRHNNTQRPEGMFRELFPLPRPVLVILDHSQDAGLPGDFSPVHFCVHSLPSLP